MIVFRISGIMYKDALSGKRAAFKGGRWNSPGTEIIYTSENRSLAMAEVLVHLVLKEVPSDLYMMIINVPDDLEMQVYLESELTKSWNAHPESEATRRIGDQFVDQNRYPIMKVPSAITKGEYNFLINPNHKDFNQIEILDVEEFIFDWRLFA